MSVKSYNCDTKEGSESFWSDQIKEIQLANSVQKKLADDREELLINYGNKVVDCDTIEDLQELKVDLKRYKSIAIQSKYWGVSVPGITVKGEIYNYESYESKTYEEVVEELDSIIDNIDEKIKLFEMRSLRNDIQNPKISSKLESPLSEEKLVEIFRVLINNNLIKETDINLWLYWFNRKSITQVSTIKWIGRNQGISDIMQQICGSCQKDAIMAAFGIKKIPNPQRKKYTENTKLFDEIKLIMQK